MVETNKTFEESGTEDGKKHYRAVTFLVDNDHKDVFVMPGKESIGSTVEYGAKQNPGTATVERHVELPVEMDADTLEKWIKDQLSREESYLKEKAEDVRKDGR